jgi:hypothetical protein
MHLWVADEHPDVGGQGQRAGLVAIRSAGDPGDGLELRDGWFEPTECPQHFPQGLP